MSDLAVALAEAAGLHKCPNAPPGAIVLCGCAPRRCAHVDPRDPDHTREGVFVNHNCGRCRDGARPCVKGEPRMCDNLHARND